MSSTRQTMAKKNIVVSIACQVITILCGLVVPRVMLGAFGSEIYGATTSIAQFLSYITLLEGGVGGVARSVLYKPLAENDSTAVSHIMHEIRSFFSIVGCIFIGYVLIVAFGFKYISGLASLDQITSVFLVLAISVSTFGQYFIGISNAVLLQAAQRSYITNFISIIATLLNAIFVCILVYFHCGIITVKLVSSMIFLLRPVAMWMYVRYKFKLKTVPKNKTKYLTQKWNGLSQHIAFYLHSNTDVAILTFFSNLYNVAVYSVYYMIISHVQSLVVAFTSGMEALFGDMLAKDEQDTLHKTFSSYEMILSLISVVLFSTTLSTILSFVRLYTSEVTDVNYTMPALALLLTIASLLYCLRIPYHSVVIAAGHFRQTQVAAYAEAAINIILSVILVYNFGVPGVAFATMIATAIRFAYYVQYLSKHIFYRRRTLFLRRFLVNFITFLVSVVAGTLISNAIEVDNYLKWAIVACLVFLISVVITFSINFVMYREELMNVLQKYKIKK